MGYLNNSTNNIIIDTVLTDKGRELLAKNDGSFSLHKFALSDDEVNYGIITKYGRAVGREKIEKNTPVFEAITNQVQAQKYKLISISNPNLVRLPKISLSGDSNVDSLNNAITLGRNIQKTATVTIEQVIQNETSIDVELRDDIFIIEVPRLFVEILRDTPEDDTGTTALYLITRSPDENSYGGAIAQFVLSVKSLTDTIFTVYGSTSNKSLINSFIKITGVKSGAVKEVSLIINKNL